MGADLRTSARDLLTLAQKASTLLQRKSDRILAEIEDADVSLTPDVEAVRSEQCQQAIDLRRHVWETSKRLKGALEHVEDIEDEDEPRILREPMEELQKLVREALNITSDPEARALLQSGKKAPKGGAPTESASRPDSSRSLLVPVGIVSGSGSMMPGTPPLAGSVHRHSVGLFSTSPKFTAQSPFSSPARAAATRLSMLTDMAPDDPLSSPLTSSTPTLKSSETALSTLKPSLTSTWTSVSDGPLSIATTTASIPNKSVTKGSPPDHSLNSAATSSSLSSAASFSTPITSPVDAPFTPPAVSTFKSHQSAEQERTASPKTETLPSPPQQRRVPRGLFSPSSVLQESRKTEQHPVPPSEISAPWLSRGGGQDTALTEGFLVSAPTHLHASNAAFGESEDSSIGRAAMVTPPPPPQTDLPFSEARSPLSPKLQRTQAKPLPIQTTSPAARRTPKSRARPDESEEEISQLARDLDSAMNPTPTDPAPQPYFLQGKGLLQRIPSQVSMDDGLLNEEQGDNPPSEESEDFDGQDSLQRGGSLRRQRSGGRRRSRFARSRSRNRSRTRGEARSKPALTPIDIGSSGTLAYSAWPFDRPPPALVSVNALEQQRRQGRSQSRSRSRSRRPSSTSPQPKPASVQHNQRLTNTGPHLPFADSVTIGNPIRIGRGIGSFTVYTVALTLCDPTTQNTLTADSSLQESRWTDARNQQQESLESSQRRLVDFANGANSAHAGHVTDPLGVERSEPKRPSMASLMMTRSLSFPGLGPSAERLLMDIQPLPETQLTSTSASTAPSGHGNSGRSNAAPLAAKRVIKVRKRYSDFVTLRTQLVETFKDRRRTQGDNNSGSSHEQTQRRRLFSASTSNSTPSSFSTVDQPRYHPARTQSLGSYQEEDDDEEDDSDDDPRLLATVGTTLATASPQNSIIRGLPKLPPKRVVGKFRPAFVEKRRRELEYFLEWVVAHPIMGDSPVVVQWFLGPSAFTT